MKFIRPIDGDVLFAVADGKLVNGKLLTTVMVQASAGKTIHINGTEAVEETVSILQKYTWKAAKIGWRLLI